MMTIEQKKAVYVAVKKSYTIATKSFTASCIYSNQIPSAFPYIMLNYADEENQDQPAVGSFLGSAGTGQRSLATLSINIEAKDAQNLNANQIASDIARQLSADIRKNWKSLSSDTVRFKFKSATRNLTHVNQAAGILDTARYQMDVYISYNLIW